MFSEMNEGPAAEQGVPPNLSKSDFAFCIFFVFILIVFNNFYLHYSLLQTLFNQDFRSMISGPRLAGSFDLSNIPFFQVMYGNVNDYAWGPEGLDAVVTQLLNQFETSGPPPMSKHDIDNLPEVAITSEQVNANLQCTVCMEDYVLDEKVKQLKCQHVFHNSCIVPWLEMVRHCKLTWINLHWIHYFCSPFLSMGLALSVVNCFRIEQPEATATTMRLRPVCNHSQRKIKRIQRINRRVRAAHLEHRLLLRLVHQKPANDHLDTTSTTNSRI